MEDKNKMEMKDVKKKEKKDIKISLRITKKVSEWLKKNEVSPQKIFDKSVEVLMK